MDQHIPWRFDVFDRHFYPPEEYQYSRVMLNDQTGREEVVHFSYGSLNNTLNEDYIYEL